MTKGSYVLVIELAAPARVAFGALGEFDLASGWYAYVGSAFGPGGFARIDRHRAIAAGENDTRHWHIDYLLGHSAARIAEAVRLPGVDAECEIARGLQGERIDGVGASDCGCPSHLVRSPERDALVESIPDATRFR